MRSPHCQITLSISIVMFAGTIGQIAAEDKDLRSRFLVEAPAAWKELQALPIECECVVEGLFGEPGEGVFEVRNGSKVTEKIAVNGAYAIVTHDEKRPDGGQIKQANGYNSAYCFSLSKTVTKDAWTVTQMLPPLGETDRSLGESFRLGTTVGTVSLVDLFQSPSIQIQDIHNEKTFVVVSFTCDVRSTPREKIIGAVLTLDPQNYWRICKSKVNVLVNGSPDTSNGEIEYYPLSYFGAARFAMPKRLSATLLLQGKEKRNVRTFSSFKKCELQEGDCTLTAFGLPEPGGGSMPGGSPNSMRRSRGAWIFSPIVWMNAVALVCLIVGFALFEWKRRSDTR